MEDVAKLICLSGGIGSGKSYISTILRLLGFQVYDCDLEARRIMDSSEDMILAIQQRFGDECATLDDGIQRAVLARKVFSDEYHRKWLNALVHKAVREDLSEWLSDISEQCIGPWFVESAIPFSSGISEMCQKVWWIEAPMDVRIERVMKRNSISREEVLKRIDSQKSEEEKANKFAELNKLVYIDNSDKNPILNLILKHIYN